MNARYRQIRSQLALLVIAFFVVSLGAQLEAQNKKERVRLNAEYIKESDGDHLLSIKASARIDRKNVPVTNIELTISHDDGEDENELGKALTDSGGTATFLIKDFNSLQPDSSDTYNFSLSFEGNDMFRKASRDISVRDANIKAELIQKDSVNYISAEILDTASDSAVAGVDLIVQVDRLFKPLKIGEDFYPTDDAGQIEVAIEEGIPGIDGILDIEVVLLENDDYGTVKTVVSAPVGVPIVEESTFDKRTMWSPRGKTPIFLLMLTYSFILVTWGIFVYLFVLLFKIAKS